MTYGVKVALTRPIKITADNKDLTFYTPYNAGVGVSLALTQGLYGDIGSVALAFRTLIRTLAASFNVAFSDGYLTLSNNASFKIVFADQALAHLLGFENKTNTASSAPYSMTATMHPLNTWISSYAPMDQGTWDPLTSAIITGRRAKSGRFVGISTGDMRWRRDFSFGFEPAHRVMREAARNANEEARTIEAFVEDSMTAIPLDGMSMSPKGIWVYSNISNLGLSADFSTLVGINHNYASTPDTRIYAHAEPGALTWSASSPRARVWYNVGLALQTADIDGGDFL